MARGTWRGAAGVALLTTGAGLFTNFLVQYNPTLIAENPGDFAWKILIFTGGLFLTSILALKGFSK